MKKPFMPFSKKVPDTFGTLTSILCMLHCVVAPILLTPLLLGQLVPTSSLRLISAPGIHEIMLGFTVIFASSSIYQSLNRGRVMPAVCLCVGMIGVLTAECFLHDEVIVRVPATFCILGGHLLAMRGAAKPCAA